MNFPRLQTNGHQQTRLFKLIRRNLSTTHDHELGSLPSCSKGETPKTKYILAMFPYPSGRLHMGHLRVYALSDVLSRYYTLKGHKVLHPIGWDAFGLPAENAAIERGIDSAEWTFRNIEEMRAQLLHTGVKFDWDRELCTCKPDYFRWTQWLFLQLHRHGFVRKAFSEVNWDPVDKTVLADEQVDAEGRSWRSGARVEKKRLNQWVVDIPRYAKVLLDGLNSFEFEWREVAAIQSDWIGICDVFRFLLPVQSTSQSQTHQGEQLDLRISDPTQLCSAQFVVLSREHQIAKEAEKLGLLRADDDFTVLEHLSLQNFVTGRPMHLVVLPKGLEDDGAEFHKDCRLGSATSNNPVDKSIAELLRLEPIPKVAIESEQICKMAESLGFGGYQTSRTLYDWVVSRQRAWGTPIPMLLEEGGNGVAPVAEQQLPVLGQQRGQRVATKSFPSGWGRLETDTLDTYFDSSWYFLRFLDPHNQQKAFEPALAQQQMPVDVYVGGVEHARMHLFFARFICHFLHNQLGLVSQPEPFQRFIPLGIVRSRSFRMADSGKYVHREEVEGDPRLPNAQLVHKPSGQPVVAQFEKMSKSKHNGVDPMELIGQYGADLTRLQLLFEARPNMPIDWPYPYPTYQIKNLRRWLGQVQKLVDDFVTLRQKSSENGSTLVENAAKEATFRGIYEQHVKSISMYLEILRYHNTALIRLMDMTKAIAKEFDPTTTAHSPQLERCLRALVVMMQVFAPDTAAKHWAKLQQVPAIQSLPWVQSDAPLAAQRWPQLDPKDTVDFVIVVFGTLYSNPASRADVDSLDEAGLLQYARSQCHAEFFRQLEERHLQVQSASVERIEGLCLVLNLKMAEEVKKRAITALIQGYTGDNGNNADEQSRGKRRKKPLKENNRGLREIANA